MFKRSVLKQNYLSYTCTYTEVCVAFFGNFAVNASEICHMIKFDNHFPSIFRTTFVSQALNRWTSEDSHSTLLGCLLPEAYS